MKTYPPWIQKNIVPLKFVLMNHKGFKVSKNIGFLSSYNPKNWRWWVSMVYLMKRTGDFLAMCQSKPAGFATKSAPLPNPCAQPDRFRIIFESISDIQNHLGRENHLANCKKTLWTIKNHVLYICLKSWDWNDVIYQYTSIYPKKIMIGRLDKFIVYLIFPLISNRSLF